MDEYEKIRQRKREEYRKRHRAQVRRKQLIGNGIVIGMIILIIATIIIVGALRGKKAKQEEVKAEVTSTLYNPIQPKLDVQLLTPNPYSRPQKALEKVNGKLSIIQQIRVRQPDKTETISMAWQRPKRPKQAHTLL